MRKLARQLATAILFNNPSTVEELRHSIMQRRGRVYLRKVSALANRLAY
jgi:hypothetical protein